MRSASGHSRNATGATSTERPSILRCRAQPSVEPSMRVKDIEGAPRDLANDGSFLGPDGRDTLEWLQIDGALDVHSRRIGGHLIFQHP